MLSDKLQHDSARQQGGIARKGRSAVAAASSTAGGVASLPGRLLRGGVKGHPASAAPADCTAEHVAPPRALLTESALAAKDAAAKDAACPVATPGTPARPAAWEARLRVRGQLQ